MKIFNRTMFRCLLLASFSVALTDVALAQSLGMNLATSASGAGADGSGFSNTKTVRDGNVNTASQAKSTTNQRVSVKWSQAQNFNTVILREQGNRITSWQLVNNDNGAVLATGSSVGANLRVDLGAVSMEKINLVVDASAAPSIAEFEVYNLAASSGSSSSSVAQSSSSQSSSSTNPPSSSSSSSIFSSSSSSIPNSGEAQSYQAESGSLGNAVVESNHSGFTGNGFVNYANVVGSYVEWTLNQATAGAAVIHFRYANGTSANRSMNIYVNDILVNSNLAFGGTGAWNSWATQTINVQLNAGFNRLRAIAATNDGGPNLDQISVVSSGASSSSSSSVIPSSSSSSSSISSSSSSSVVISSSSSSSSSSLSSSGSSNSSVANGEVLAFPGAAGFGRLATGGRYGDVYTVTHLNDSGVGSLRDAINTTGGPRTIVFAVSGNIMLQSKLDITRHNITIAGQTAPGDGITLAGYPVNIMANNIIIRYVRFRSGDFNMMAGNGKEAKGNGDLKGSTAGALDIVNSSHVIVDHVSTSWAIDETLSATYSNYVTVQNSIVSESLNDSNHDKGPHGFGSLIRGNGEGGYTFYRNLYAHHDMRNPGAGSNQTTATIKGQLDFVNNVVYGWGTRSGEAIDGSRGGVVELNYVNNYVIANADSRNSQSVWDEEKTLGILTYQSGNKLDSNINGVLDGVDNGWAMFPNFIGEQQKSVRWNFPQVDTVSAEQAYEEVLNDVGASLVRDAIDARVVQQVLTNTGRIIDSQDDVGGLPELNSSSAPVDSDKDGMPDDWELARGLNPDNIYDRNEKTLDGMYTNLEVYLNSLVQ